jgi:hypothetical protein
MRSLVRLFRPTAGVLCGMLVLSIGALPLRAQSATGKVQGTVLDPTGQPVANAQVSVLGTGFNVLTDASGYYFFNHVPAGTYNLRAQFIGYQPAEVQGVRVLADQTLTVNFGLSGAVTLEAIVVTAAETPIVPRDVRCRDQRAARRRHPGRDQPAAWCRGVEQLPRSLDTWGPPQ